MRPLLNPHLSRVPQYVTAGAVPTHGVRLASNENAHGPSPRVHQAVVEALTDLHRYPDPSGWWLREALSAHLDVDVAQLMVGNGATELIDLVARAVIEPGDNTIYANPSFVMFRIAPMRMGAEVRQVPLTGHAALDLASLRDAVDARTKLVYLANPNNPTGSYVGRDDLARFAAELPDQVLLVVDEAYAEYAVAPDFPNAVELLPLRERLVVARTFSKCHGLAALRAGYLLGNASVMDTLERARLPFSINSLAQVAAVAALSDPGHVARCCERNRTEMAWLARELEGLGCVVAPSQANFLLADLGGTGLVEALGERGVLIRSMAPYGMPTSARVTVGTRADSVALCEALGGALAERARTAA